MTHLVFRRLNSPCLVLFRDVVQNRRHVGRDGEPGMLGRLSYHEPQRHRLPVPYDRPRNRPGNPPSVVSGSPKTSFWTVGDTNWCEQNSLSGTGRWSGIISDLRIGIRYFNGTLDSTDSTWLTIDWVVRYCSRTCRCGVVVYLHHMYSSSDSSGIFVFIQCSTLGLGGPNHRVGETNHGEKTWVYPTEMRSRRWDHSESS